MKGRMEGPTVTLQEGPRDQPEGIFGWHGWPRVGYLVKGTGDPSDYARVETRDLIRKN
jgi:hypothetical protein